MTAAVAIAVAMMTAALAVDAPPAEACVLATPREISDFERALVARDLVIARNLGPAPSSGSELDFEIVRVLRSSEDRVGQRVQLRGSVTAPPPDADPCLGWLPTYPLGQLFLLSFEVSGKSAGLRRLHSAVPIELGSSRLAALVEYVRIAALEDPERRLAALDELIAAGQHPESSTATVEIARRTFEYFAWPIDAMTTVELMRTYQGAEGTTRRIALEKLSARADPRAVELMRGALTELLREAPEERARLRAAVQGYFAAVDDAAGRALMVELVRFEARQRDQRAAVVRAVLHSRDDAEAERLGLWLLRHAPELAADRDALAARVDRRYAELPRLASLLAELGDRDVASWARRELLLDTPRRAVAVRVLAHTAEHALATRSRERRLFAREHAALLLEELAEAHHGGVAEYLEEVERLVENDVVLTRRVREVRLAKAALLRKACEQKRLRLGPHSPCK